MIARASSLLPHRRPRRITVAAGGLQPLFRGRRTHRLLLLPDGEEPGEERGGGGGGGGGSAEEGEEKDDEEGSGRTDAEAGDYPALGGEQVLQEGGLPRIHARHRNTKENKRKDGVFLFYFIFNGLCLFLKAEVQVVVVEALRESGADGYPFTLCEALPGSRERESTSKYGAHEREFTARLFLFERLQLRFTRIYCYFYSTPQKQ